MKAAPATLDSVGGSLLGGDVPRRAGAQRDFSARRGKVAYGMDRLRAS